MSSAFFIARSSSAHCTSAEVPLPRHNRLLKAPSLRAPRALRARRAPERALKEDPDCCGAEFLRGRIANARNRFELPATHRERAVVLDPAAAHAQSELGRAYHPLRRRGEPEAAYTKSLALKADP